MTTIESEKVELQHSNEKLFGFLSDFRNYKSLMPDQVTDWVAVQDSGSFSLKGLGKVGLRITEMVPASKILIVPNGKLPVDFNLEIKINPLTDNSCQAQIMIHSDMNPMMKMMVEKPLKNFISYMANKLNNLPL